MRLAARFIATMAVALAAGFRVLADNAANAAADAKTDKPAASAAASAADNARSDAPSRLPRRVAQPASAGGNDPVAANAQPAKNSTAAQSQSGSRCAFGWHAGRHRWHERGNGYTPQQVEWFFGYSFWRAMPTSFNNRIGYMHGGSTSIAYNFNNYFGLAADFAGFDDNKVTLFHPFGRAPPCRRIGKAWTLMDWSALFVSQIRDVYSVCAGAGWRRDRAECDGFWLHGRAELHASRR